MIFLVDTGPVINYLNEDQATIADLQSRMREGLAISSISIAEVYEGVFRSPNFEEAERVLSDFLSHHDILVVDENIGRVFGRQRALLRRKGTPMSDLDLLIACTALHYDLTLITIDRDFERIEELQTIYL